MRQHELQPSLLFDKICEALVGRGFFSAFALVGSRAREDNFTESDYDILVVDTRSLSSLLCERIVLEGESIDLVHVPVTWLTGQIPYELDQMINESKILADRDGILTSAQKWIKAYNYESARMAGRMGEIILKSNVLLSRASSALSRLDYESCIMHSKIAAILASRVLLEMNRVPYQASKLAELLKSSSKVEVSHIIPSADQAESAKSCLQAILHQIGEISKIRDQPTSESIEQMWTASYYSNEDFAHRITRLVGNLIAENRLQDVVLYTQINAYRILEAYQLLVKKDTMIDYVTMLRQMKSRSDSGSTQLYAALRTVYNIQESAKSQAAETLRQAREHAMALKRLVTYTVT